MRRVLLGAHTNSKHVHGKLERLTNFSVLKLVYHNAGRCMYRMSKAICGSLTLNDVMCETDYTAWCVYVVIHVSTRPMPGICLVFTYGIDCVQRSFSVLLVIDVDTQTSNIDTKSVSINFQRYA